MNITKEKRDPEELPVQEKADSKGTGRGAWAWAGKSPHLGLEMCTRACSAWDSHFYIIKVAAAGGPLTEGLSFLEPRFGFAYKTPNILG